MHSYTVSQQVQFMLVQKTKQTEEKINVTTNVSTA